MKEADGSITAKCFPRNPHLIWDICVAKLFLQLSAENRVLETEEFAQRPSLKRTAARSVRRFSVGDFRDMAQAGFIQMFVEGWKEPIAGILRSRIESCRAHVTKPRRTAQ